MRERLKFKAGEESIFDALISARERFGDKPILEDQDRNPLTYTGVIRAAMVLGRKIAEFTEPGERVALLLPTSSGMAICYYGLLAHGRVPVMLNFTSGERNVKAAIQAAGVKTVLSAKRFISQAKLEDLVAHIETVAKVIWLDDVRKTIGLGDKAYGLLAGMFPRQFRVKTDPASPGVILFTSGSFGVPKGVVLSHDNLVANCRQVAQHIDLKPEWSIFNPMPTFHCLGLTGGVLLPLLSGLKVFQYPSPLHGKQIVELLPEIKPSILFATDTFLNQWARLAGPDDFDSLLFVVAGAEKVRDETHHMFNTRFHGLKLLEGYGATEAAPVVAVNHPDRNRPGTVGQMLPGMEWRLESIPGIDEGGRLFLRGPNVMSGYLSADDPERLEVLEGGWHDTGDIVVIDGDGYVTIQGRIKRFAKIAGEMVSLTAVEGLADAVWPDNRNAVIAIPDSRKGEKLVLVTDRQDAEVSRLTEWAREHGAPELVVPKKIIKVPALPVLGTGKTDYVSLQNLVASEVQAA